MWEITNYFSRVGFPELLTKICSPSFFSGGGVGMTHSYSVCIRQELGFCCVQFVPCADVANPFTLDTMGQFMAAATDTVCTVDFIGIAGTGMQISLFVSSNSTRALCFPSPPPPQLPARRATPWRAAPPG